MNSNSNKVNHGVTFTLLLTLVVASVGTSLLHLPAGVNNAIVLTIAVVMAGLVVAEYMGLRLEGRLVGWIFLIPLILFSILVVLLLPDIAHVPINFLRVL